MHDQNRIRKGAAGFLPSDRSAGGTIAHMCEWCHAIHAGDGVTMLTATASSHRRVGLHLCRDLGCKSKTESSPGVNDIPETLTGQQKVRRIVQRMNDFARQNLF